MDMRSCSAAQTTGQPGFVTLYHINLDLAHYRAYALIPNSSLYFSILSNSSFIPF